MIPPTPKRIKKVRKQMGLSVKEASKVARSSERAWYHWEKGERVMPLGLWELFLLKIKIISVGDWL